VVVYPPPPHENEQFYLHSLAFSKQWEGGFICHPADPGGATNLGVTQAVFDRWQKERPSEYPVRKSVRDLTEKEAEEIYYLNYWVPSRANEMRWPLCMVQLDTAINFGIKGATEFLQEALSVKQDGIWGPQTQGAYNAAPKECLCQLVIFARRRYRYERVYRSPSQATFLDGWTARDTALLELVNEHIELMAGA